MTNTLAHTFDCECIACTAQDSANPVGMDLFRKPRKAVTGLIAENVRIIDTATVKAEPIRRLPAGQRVGRGRVRKISTKQENFILSLIAQRDLTDLKLVTGQTLDPNEIPYMGVKGASALIDKLLGCPIKGTNSPVAISPVNIPGSEKQVAWIKTMASERNLSESDLKLIIKANPTARLLIDTLRSMPLPSKREMLKAEITRANEDEEYVPSKIIPGYYRDNNGDVWRAQFNKAETNIYALKRITPKKYEYDAKGIYSLTPAMFVSVNPLDVTIEEAKAYGRKTGTCYMCSRELTKQSSIDAGIGPICASKF